MPTSPVNSLLSQLPPDPRDALRDVGLQSGFAETLEEAVASEPKSPAGPQLEDDEGAVDKTPEDTHDNADTHDESMPGGVLASSDDRATAESESTSEDNDQIPTDSIELSASATTVDMPQIDENVDPVETELRPKLQSTTIHTGENTAESLPGGPSLNDEAAVSRHTSGAVGEGTSSATIAGDVLQTSNEAAQPPPANSNDETIVGEQPSSAIEEMAANRDSTNHQAQHSTEVVSRNAVHTTESPSHAAAAALQSHDNAASPTADGTHASTSTEPSHTSATTKPTTKDPSDEASTPELHNQVIHGGERKATEQASLQLDSKELLAPVEQIVEALNEGDAEVELASRDTVQRDRPTETSHTFQTLLERSTASGARRSEHVGQSDTDSLRVDTARFVSRVARAFDAAVQRGGNIQLRLSPPELGAMKIEMQVHHGTMTAKLETETAAAKNLLLDNLPALRDRLATQDIRVDKFEVDVRQQGSGSGSDWQAQQERRDANDRTSQTSNRLEKSSAPAAISSVDDKQPTEPNHDGQFSAVA